MRRQNKPQLIFSELVNWQHIAFRTNESEIKEEMLKWSVIFFIVAIIAAIFGFTGISAGAASIAKILFFIFLVLFLLTLIGGAWLVKK